ncbi:MAG: hypothetical protein ABW200_01935 [Hyphomicrobiaceae bacterium]
MSISASLISRPLDWKVWAPGYVLPTACVVGDVAIGEYVLWLAPAALLALMAMSMAALAIARKTSGATANLTLGPLWVASVSALMIGAVLVLLVPLGIMAAIGALTSGQPIGLLLLICALLAATPIWTGIAYLRGAIALSRQQALAHGMPAALLQILFGAVLTLAAAIGLQVADSRYIDSTISRLDNASPAIWRETFATLGAYALCGRWRCQSMVCMKLLTQFPADPTATMRFGAVVPAPLEATFAKAYGGSTESVCARVLD